MNKIFLACTIVFFGFSCKKDLPQEEIVISEINGGQGLFVGSEGNFQFGNASLSYYDYNSEVVNPGVFKNTNGSELGDVLHSMYQDETILYLVMNNSSKIEMIDKYTFKSKGALNGFVSPRYFLPVSNSKAYVSDLYSNTISVVDLNQNSIVNTIKTSGWTEEILLLYGKAFVCNKGKDLLYVVDTSTDQIVDSITVGSSPSSMQQDKNGKLWVLCQGVINDGSKVAGLYRVNPISHVVEMSFQFNNGNQVSKLNINGGNDTLYYLSAGSNNGVYRMTIDAVSTPSSAFILGGQGANYYGLTINPRNGDVFVSDAIDYLQKSKVSRYNAKGELLKSFNSGVNTSSFSFFK